MKKIIQVITFAICVSFTSKLYSQTSNDTLIYSKQNVALIDAVIRSIDEEHYVKEIYYKDFNGSMSLPQVVDYEGTNFIDNGLGFDLTAGDGIYTSIDKFIHTAKIPYRSDTLIRSVLDECYVDSSFQHNGSLTSFLNSYNVPGFESKIKITIACDVHICSCTSCTCKTCWTFVSIMPGAPPILIKHCLKITNCRFEIEW